MSSFRKAAKTAQKTHRERSKPTDHLGYLEKKKDYKKRANDYHSKQNRLKSLQRKALNRNPDEFYFKMVNSKLQDGVHKWRKKEEVITREQQLMMDTQDKRYVNHKLTVETKKIEKLNSSLHYVQESIEKPKNKHTFFVDSKQEVEDFDVKAHQRTFQSEDSLPLEDSSEFTLEEILDIEKSRKYRELRQRKDRQKQLKIIAGKMQARSIKKDTRKKVMVAKETISSPAVYKFFPERKR
ncbi:probable U3 small nucleolar RNA-associated protein 11 [Asterias amurensis]|uniref:probable U3 small nucleolar RNA-associated protein 11 n=1 Tax=Asterias amurensis TaxID=7602 RepID=UPI003AB64668